MKCYFTGEECTCGSFDVVGECPHDAFVHETDPDRDSFDEDEEMWDYDFRKERLCD